MVGGTKNSKASPLMTLYPVHRYISETSDSILLKTEQAVKVCGFLSNFSERELK
jgi:hypothetical protein